MHFVRKPNFDWIKFFFIIRKCKTDCGQFREAMNATTVPGIGRNDVEKLRLPFPPIAEQRRIVAELDALQAEVDALKRLQAETAAELDALLPVHSGSGIQRRIMKKIILGYPYDGALFWLLTTSEHHNAKDGRPYSGGHPYYERLYGPKHIEFAPRAASLCVLYDEVIAAPADIGLPDRQSYQSNNEYFNPHLGLRTNWLDFRTAQEWLEEQVRKTWKSQRSSTLFQPILGRENFFLRGLICKSC